MRRFIAVLRIDILIRVGLVGSPQKRIAELEAAQKIEQRREPIWPTPNLREEDLFGEMERMQEEVNRLFRDSSRRGSTLAKGMLSSNMSFQNKINMQETPEGYEITLDMSGLEEKSLNIDIQPDAITLKGQSSAEESTKEPDGSTALRSYTSFLQRIALPPDADFSKIKTEKKDKGMIIFIPKKAKP